MNTLKQQINQKIASLMAVGAMVVLSLASVSYAQEDKAPDEIIGGAVQTLLDQFTERRNEFEGDKQALFDMVNDVTDPYFDFDKISKLILSDSWKTATEMQQQEFRDEFRTLLIKTYATALFQYTGNEKMVFQSSNIKERKGVKSARVVSEVSLSDGPPIPVIYSMILGDENDWKIYNMEIAGINMVTNYRETYGASVRKIGLDGLIASMKEVNAKN